MKLLAKLFYKIFFQNSSTLTGKLLIASLMKLSHAKKSLIIVVTPSTTASTMLPMPPTPSPSLIRSFSSYCFISSSASDMVLSYTYTRKFSVLRGALPNIILSTEHYIFLQLLDLTHTQQWEVRDNHN
jgi:hypothetical protein